MTNPVFKRSILSNEHLSLTAVPIEVPFPISPAPPRFTPIKAFNYVPPINSSLPVGNSIRTSMPIEDESLVRRNQSELQLTTNQPHPSIQMNLKLATKTENTSAVNDNIIV